MLIAIIGVTGCAKVEQEEKKASLLALAIPKFQDAAKYEINKTMIMNIKTIEDEANVEQKTNIKAVEKQNFVYEMNTETSITMGGETQIFDMKQYLFQTNNQYRLYTSTSDGWDKENIQEEQINALSQKPSYQLMHSYIQANQIEEIRKQKVNVTDEIEIKCLEVKYELGASNIKSLVTQLGDLDSFGVDKELLDTKVEEQTLEKPIEVYFYFNEETGDLIKESCDLSEFMRDIVLESEGVNKEEISDFEFKLEITYHIKMDLAETLIPNEIKK